MSDLPTSAPRKRTRQATAAAAAAAEQQQNSMNGTAGNIPSHHAHTSSLQSVTVVPRSPKNRGEYPLDHDEDEVEMHLLAGHTDDSEPRSPATNEKTSDKPLSKKDKNAMILLIVLCKPYFTVILLYHLNVSTCLDLIQGVPVSLNNVYHVLYCL